MVARYERFIKRLHEQLVAAIGEAENCEWHHLPQEDPRAAHYCRLLTWATELEERVKYYDHVQKRRPAWVQTGSPSED